MPDNAGRDHVTLYKSVNSDFMLDDVGKEHGANMESTLP